MPVRLADERHLAVPEPGQVLDAQPARLREVQVNAVKPGRVRGQADQHRVNAGLPDHGDALVFHADVGEDHRVRPRARRDPPDALRPLVIGQQQHVVAEPPGHRGHRDRDVHHHRHVQVPASGTTSASTLDFALASARAPACGW